MKFDKRATQRGERSIYARSVVASMSGSQTSNSTVLPEGYTQLSVAKTGTGVYVYNFTVPFVRAPIVMAEALHASAFLVVVVAAISTSSVTVNCFTSSTGAAADATQILLDITGFDVVDQA